MSNKIFTKNRDLLRTIILLAWPAILQEALQTIVQYIDTAMVGQIGADASAAVGLTTSMTWLVNSPSFAIGIGVLACIAESIGAGKQERAREFGIQALHFAAFLGVGLGIITLAISPFLPGWLGADPSIRRDAGLYFAIICAPMLFRTFSIILSSVLRGAGDTKSPMYANLVMNLINLILNYFLIYGPRTVSLGDLKLRLPGAGLGVTGAALGTAIAYCCGGLLMFAAYYRNPLLKPRGCSLRLVRPLAQRCLRIGIPVALERVSACLGQVVFISIVARLGTLALATHSIAITAEQAFYIPGYGMQAAASTMAGNALGAGDQQRFCTVTHLIVSITVGLMVITGGLLFAFPGFMMSIFSPDARVIAGGMVVLRIVAVSEPLFGAVTIFEGLFNGIGDTKAPFIISIFAMWGVRIIGSLLCIHLLHGGLPMLWCCMVADNTTRCALLSYRYLRGLWRRKFAQAAI